MSAKRQTKKPQRRGPGRPATGSRVKKKSITLPDALWEKADQFCFENVRSLSSVISEALGKHLEEVEK